MDTSHFLTKDPRFILSKAKAVGRASTKHSGSDLAADPYSFLSRAPYLADAKGKSVDKRRLEVLIKCLAKEYEEGLKEDLMPDKNGNWFLYQRATPSQIRQIVAVHDLLVHTLEKHEGGEEIIIDFDESFIGLMTNPLVRKNAILQTMLGDWSEAKRSNQVFNKIGDKADEISQNLLPSHQEILAAALDKRMYRAQSEDFSEGASESKTISSGLHKIRTMYPPLGSSHIKGIFLILEVPAFRNMYPDFVQPFINLTELVGVKDLLSIFMSKEWILLSLDSTETQCGYSSLNSYFPMIYGEGRIMASDNTAINIEVCFGAMKTVPRKHKIKDVYDLKIESVSLSPYVLVVDNE